MCLGHEQSHLPKVHLPVEGRFVLFQPHLKKPPPLSAREQTEAAARRAEAELARLTAGGSSLEQVQAERDELAKKHAQATSAARVTAEREREAHRRAAALETRLAEAQGREERLRSMGFGKQQSLESAEASVETSVEAPHFDDSMGSPRLVGSQARDAARIGSAGSYGPEEGEEEVGGAPTTPKADIAPTVMPAVGAGGGANEEDPPRTQAWGQPLISLERIPVTGDQPVKRLSGGALETADSPARGRWN